MNITDQEIYNNRMKWIEYLKRPETRKHKGSLEDFEDPECRCCLGHACHVLAPDTRTVINSDEQVFYDEHSASMPDKLVLALGLYNDLGGAANIGETYLNVPKVHPTTCLADLNDNTKITPQEIGAYLESVIMGGEDTPFKKIDVEVPK